VQLVSEPAAVERVLKGLARRRDALVGAVVSEAGEQSGYAGLPAGQAADFEATVLEGFDAILHALTDQRSFTEHDVAFLWPHIRTRAEAGVPEGDMLAVVRLFQRALWEAIVELAGDDEDGRAAALTLARPLIGYIDVLSRVVTEAFTETEEALSSRASVVRQTVIETLLAGAELDPGTQLNVARQAGLDRGCPLTVVAARPTGDELDEAALGVAAVALARATGDALEPLSAVRGDEIIVIRATQDDDLRRETKQFRAAVERLDERRLPLAVGVSTVHAGLAAVPAAYHEACLALQQLPSTGGVLALGELGVADYLILRAGDDTAWRLIPEGVREFVQDDVRQGGALSATLLAFVSSDLNVKLAAERLFVHPNTVHYRLSRIEERTGCSARKLSDVLLLAIAIQLQRRRARS
jgi:PucR C-terminal helix-turn-helix domain/GGDEF-like domain